MRVRFVLLGLLLLALGSVLPSSPRAYSARAVAAPLRLESSTAAGIIFTFESPAYEIARETIAGRAVQRIVLPGAQPATTPGTPDLPQWSTLLGVPAQAQLRLRILSDTPVPVPQPLQVPLVPSPAPVSVEPGEPVDPRMPQGSVQPLVSVGAAEITEDAWLRDQRLVRVVLHPFEYTSAGQLIWHRYLRIEVSWPGQTALLAQPLSEQAAAQPFDTALRNQLLNYESARMWRVRGAAGSTTARDFVQPQATAEQPRYKITVDHDGLYQLRYADLQAAGLAVDTVDPRRFKLTSQGRAIAIQVRGEADGRFDPQDTITFYGEQYRQTAVPDTLILDGQLVTQPSSLSAMYSDATTYTDDNVYWLEVNGSPGPRMLAVDGTPRNTAPVPTFYRATIRAEQSNIWWTRHFTSRDAWFWNAVQTSTDTTRSYPVTLSAIAPDAPPALVRGEVMSRQGNPGVDPDHHTRFMFNTPATVIEDQFWDGPVRHRFSGAAPAAALREGDNALLFNVQIPNGIAADWLYFDWFEIEYGRRFEAEQDQLLFTATETDRRQYELSRFTDPAINVYDVTDPQQPRVVSGGAVTAENGAYRVAWEATNAATTRYAVAAQNGLQTPKQIARVLPSGLRSTTQGADYIIVTPPDFRAAAQELADFRAARGLRATVVDLNDIFNDFNDGIYNPVAIKRFLAYAYANWQAPAPSYVVLIGDGSWNPKGYNAAQYGAPPTYMPPNLAWADPVLGEVDSANLLAAFVGDDILPDLAISRMPVNSSAELRAIVAKIKRYEAAPTEDWQQRLVFVADNTPDPAGDFEELSEMVIRSSVPPDWNVQRLYVNALCGPTTTAPTTCPAINQALINDLNTSGALFVNYVGHASVDWWASEEALTPASLGALSNGDKLPIILSMTCLDGYWIYPNRTSLIEEFVRADNRGAIAAFSPTGYGVANGHDILHRGFYDALFVQGQRTFGPATMTAKLALFAVGGHDDLINTFTVFGDPALRLPIPGGEPAPMPRTYLYLPWATQQQ